MSAKRVVLLSLCVVVCQLCQAQAVTHIDRTPLPEEKTYSLSVSSNSLSFSASGGKQTITVTSSQAWKIDVNTDSWVHVTKNGSQLTITIDANDKTSSREAWFDIKSGDKTQRVNISQKAKEKPKEYSLSVSSSSLSFPASGGTQTITVTSSQSWEIGVDAASWGHLTKNGSQLTVRIDANTSTLSRADYFTIKSGNITRRVEISQDPKEDFLSVSKSSLSFSYSGGTQTITISSSQEWKTMWVTDSWVHVTKNGSQLTITIDANDKTSSREAWFDIKSGDKTQRVSISQSGCTTTTTSTTTATTSSYSIIRPANLYYDYHDTGSIVQFGIVVTDFAWNLLSTGNGNVWHWNAGLSVKFGHHRSPVQFELGVEPGILFDLEDYYDDDYSRVRFRMPIYARLKINLFNVWGDNGKFYISGMAYYNVVRDKDYENSFSAGGGAGFAWRHWDWQTLYYKQDVSHDCWRRDRFFGTALFYYF